MKIIQLGREASHSLSIIQTQTARKHRQRKPAGVSPMTRFEFWNQTRTYRLTEHLSLVHRIEIVLQTAWVRFDPELRYDFSLCICPMLIFGRQKQLQVYSDVLSVR